MEPVAIVTALILLQYFYFSISVGAARGRTGVSAPATSGHPEFDRYFRVQQNTLEQLIIVLPSLWLFGTYVDARIAAGLGLVFIVGRFIFARAYVNDPAKRTIGFVTGFFATAILLLGGLGGAVYRMM
ncbi:MAG: MAPEG family protein [Gammaproteobacteria bacterium]